MPQQVRTVTAAEMIEMVLSQFACWHLEQYWGADCRLPGWLLACERQGVPVPRDFLLLRLPYLCTYATALRAGWSDRCRADLEQTSHDSAGVAVAVAFCAVCRGAWRTHMHRRADWTLDSEASRRPGARTLPPARLQSAVVKTAVVAQAPSATASPDRPHRVRQVYSRAASKYIGSVARLRSHAVSECIGIAELPAWQTLVTDTGQRSHSQVLTQQSSTVGVRSAAPRPVAMSLHNRQTPRSPRHPHGTRCA